MLQTRKERCLKIILATCLGAVMLFGTVACGTDNSNGNASGKSENTQEQRGQNEGDSQMESVDVGRTSMPDSYKPGEIQDGCYVNETIGIKYIIPSNFTVKHEQTSPNCELELEANDGAELLIGYVTDGVVEDFVQEAYAMYKSQELVDSNYMVDLINPEIAGAQRYVIVEQTQNNTGDWLYTASAFFERNHHIVCVNSQSNDMYDAIGLVVLTQAIEE